MTTIEMKCHPACLLLPEMGDAEYRELVEDIRVNGLQQPVLRAGCNGPILDGRHRLRACQELGIDPRFQAYVPPLGGAELEAAYVAKVVFLNIHRRHLTTQQRAAIGAELAKMQHGGDRKSAATKASNDALTDAQVAKLMNVSEPSIERAKKRMRTDPDAHAKAKARKLGRAKPTKRITKTKPLDGDRDPTPKRDPKPDVRLMVNHLLGAIPKNFNATAWAADMPEFLRKNTAAAIKELRDRLLILEDVLTMAPQRFAAEVLLDPTPEFCDFAGAIGRAVDQLVESTERISPRTGKPMRKYTKR
jgi:ParB-like nuclease domain